MAALNDAMKLKGRGAMNAVAREIAWRRVALQWRFRTMHLPKEINLLADALSWLRAAPPHVFPDVLQTCHRVNPGLQSELRKAWVPVVAGKRHKRKKRLYKRQSP